MNNPFRWEPKPVSPPKADPQIGQMDSLSRSAEAIRYSILSIEFWISPDGQAREWLRNHTRLAVLLGIPAILVMPLIGFILWQLLSWAGMLTSLAGKMIILPIAVLIAVVVIKAAVAILKQILR